MSSVLIYTVFENCFNDTEDDDDQDDITNELEGKDNCAYSSSKYYRATSL